MSASEKVRVAFAAAAVAGVFALCAVSVAQGQLDLKAALAVALASLTSVGAVTGIFKSDPK